MSKIILQAKALHEQVYQYIKVHNATVGTKELRQQFGKQNTDNALQKLHAKKRIRRVKILNDDGINYVYKVIE